MTETIDDGSQDLFDKLTRLGIVGAIAQHSASHKNLQLRNIIQAQSLSIDLLRIGKGIPTTSLLWMYIFTYIVYHIRRNRAKGYFEV